MTKKIIITGATDGIGLEAAKLLLGQEHHVLIHGRNPEKLQKVERELSKLGTVESYIADLSTLSTVTQLANAISQKHGAIDVLINNAGVLQSKNAMTQDGLDVRFSVNTIAPYLLTKSLLHLLGKGRVINLSSAAQMPVDLDALAGKKEPLAAMVAYSQSKLGITMWSRTMAYHQAGKGPVIIAVNPGSLLASKMVKEGFGIDGKDIRIGADILVRLALSDDFSGASGQYFDNDAGQIADPHPDALDLEKCQRIVEAIETIIETKVTASQ